MEFQTKNYYYNYKANVLREFDKSDFLTYEISKNPSILGFTKKTLAEGLMFGYKKNGSILTEKEAESLIEHCMTNPGKYTLTEMALSYCGIFEVETTKVGGRNTLKIKTIDNYPPNKWHEILNNILSKINYSSLVQKVHMVGYTSKNIATILNSPTEIEHFIQTKTIQNETKILSDSQKNPFPFIYAGTKTKSRTRKEFNYNFNLPDETNVIVTFDYDFEEKHAEIVFSRRKENKLFLHVSGDGSATRIFTTVMEVIKKFLRDFQKPQRMTFSAELYGSNSRRRVYSKMIDRYSESFGYTKEYEKNINAAMVFSLVLNKDAI